MLMYKSVSVLPAGGEGGSGVEGGSGINVNVYVNV
jgi:hypothetical protein